VPKILVADDNANIQKMVVLAFQDRGIQVVAVANGEAAVRRIPDLDPDLVLADIFMPVRNGYEVCEFVKKDDRFAHIPVILLVGAFDPLDEKEARRVGADGVLKKPFIPPDPLIAMVMSALEKNPRVVAELAKAKEAKESPEPHPMPQLEIASSTGPKTLPQFPEPSPEEAAIVYGFGSGRRALDGEKAAAEDQELVDASAGADEADGAAFDSAATSRDWRRTAMEFEVSAQDANRPAFSSNDDLEPVTFPSERDVPPRHVRLMETAGELDTSVQDQEPESQQTGPSPVTSFVSSAAPVVSEPPAPSVIEAEPFSHEAPETESQPESSSPPKAAHWMDAVMPSHSDYPQTDWMNALSAPPPAETISATPVEQPSTDSLVLHASPIEAAKIPAETASEVSAVSAETVVEASTQPGAEADGAHSTALVETDDEPFFAAEPESSPRTDSWFAPAPPAGETSHALESQVVSGNFRADQNLEAEPEHAAPSVAFKDPALVESLAVRVTPEPLLVDDEPPESGQYGSRAGEIAPARSFFAPPSESPIEDEPAEQEASAHGDAPAQPFGAWAEELNERIPTGPPPNREALAEIPFLTPPADFQRDSDEETAANSEAVNVDDLVRRVLQKLEPQLHELLSQGVLKPIVENILQNELAKKETTR
jgi:CheY-like chemotaxis protein